jgi:glycosyltransferase involved in cell wall biosynthesis
MDELISIIMPAYKAEKTIKRSIESILSQDYKNIELIIVIDGFDDPTYEICKEINDSRLKIFRKENGGVVGAYKYGIKQAQGKYLGFCDSDDTYKAGFITKGISIINENNCDFVSFAYDVVNSKGEITESNRNYIDSGLYDYNTIQNDIIPNLIFNSFVREKMYPLLMLRWNKIYKKELIDSFTDILDDKCRQIEDNFFVINTILNSKSFYISNEFKCYNYLIADTSISSGYSDSSILDAYLYTISKIEKLAETNPLLNKHQIDFLAYDSARIVFHRCAKYTDYKTSKELIKRISKLDKVLNVKFKELKMFKNFIYHLCMKLHLYRILYYIFKR